MIRRLIRQEVISALIVLIAGILLHFVYQWSGKNSAVAVISSVNESVWEHMKLLFVPTAIDTLVRFWVKGHIYPNFPAAIFTAIPTSLPGCLLCRPIWMSPLQTCPVR